MKYAILGDIHANLEALEAVLKHANDQSVDRFACVGDVVGYNANPVECLARIRGIEAVLVRGNHDHYVCHDEVLHDLNPIAASVVEWTRAQLSEADLQFLKRTRMVRTVDGITFVHSTLDEPDKWGYVFEEREAEASFNYQTTTVCFHGHTHVPTVFEKTANVRRQGLRSLRITLGRKYFINVGSVGQPRDGDPRAAYVTYDTRTREVELHRVPYEIAAAQERILAAGLPRALAARLAVGR